MKRPVEAVVVDLETDPDRREGERDGGWPLCPKANPAEREERSGTGREEEDEAEEDEEEEEADEEVAVRLRLLGGRVDRVQHEPEQLAHDLWH